jgi:hypothetical protein
MASCELLRTTVYLDVRQTMYLPTKHSNGSHLVPKDEKSP